MANEVATIASEPRQIDLKEGYTSIRATDMETKKKVYAAVTAPAELADFVGKEIVVENVITQKIYGQPDERGVVDVYTRSILIAPDGKAYAASSTGIINSLETAVAIFGEPEWKGGLAFTVRQGQSTNNKAWKFLTLDIVL